MIPGVFLLRKTSSWWLKIGRSGSNRISLHDISFYLISFITFSSGSLICLPPQVGFLVFVSVALFSSETSRHISCSAFLLIVSKTIVPVWTLSLFLSLLTRAVMPTVGLSFSSIPRYSLSSYSRLSIFQPPVAMSLNRCLHNPHRHRHKSHLTTLTNLHFHAA